MANVTPHKHCIVCGSAIEPGGTFCDELCELRFKSGQRRQQAIFALFIIILLLITIAPMLSPLINALKSW